MRLFLALMLFSQVVFADSYVFLVDTSGSMAEPISFKKDGKTYNSSRMQVAKESMKEVVENIPEDADVSILTFGGWRYSGKMNSHEVSVAINTMTPAGGTPLGEYMKIGADKLLQLRKDGDRGGTYNLIIVTDGEANDDRKVDRYLPEILSRGLIVKAIGLDMAKTHSLATKVNEYTNANDPDALTSSLKKYVAEVNFEDKNLQEEVFEEIKGLPNDVAFSVIQKLTDQPNHPIGEEAPVQMNQSSTVAPSSSSPSPSSEESSGALSTLWTVLGIFVTVAIIVVMAGHSVVKK